MEGSNHLGAGAEPRLNNGWVDDDIREEFPGVRLLWLLVDAVSGRSPRSVKQRLELMSDRFRGSTAVTMRQEPVPWAYRVFFRHIGLDPDAERTPLEAVAMERLLRGGFKSRNLLDDALTISLVETGVPMWALDASGVQGGLGLRVAGEGERLGRGEEAPPVPEGRLVVADALSPLAVLFGDLAPGHGVTNRTRSMTLFTVQVPRVPDIHVEEALFTCLDLLSSQ